MSEKPYTEEEMQTPYVGTNAERAGKELKNKLTPKELATQVLFSPEKMSNAVRRRAMRMRETVVHIGTEPKPFADRCRGKFRTLTIGPLIRRIQRHARHAAHFRYQLEKLSSDSVFAPPLRVAQHQHLTAFALASAEWQRRINPEPILEPIPENEIKS